MIELTAAGAALCTALNLISCTGTPETWDLFVRRAFSSERYQHIFMAASPSEPAPGQDCIAVARFGLAHSFDVYFCRNVIPTS